MLPRVQPYQTNASGESSAGLFEDISTRSLQTVRVGESAGKVSSGVGNAFVGYESGKENTRGNYGTFVGYQAGSLNTSASYATLVGAFAGKQNINGSEVVFVGYRAGELNKDGKSVVAVGSYAMRENVSGTGSVAIGYRTGERNLDGDYNTMIGAESGQDNRSGNMNTMCGFRSGRASFMGHENTYVGAYSGYSNTDGSGNSFIGYKSGENVQHGNFNVAVGAFSLQNCISGSCNIAIGPYAGATSSSSSNSVLIGKNAASRTTNGNDNVIIGTDAAEYNSGDENVIIGSKSGRNSTSYGSVILGTNAGENASGMNSVIIGNRAGKNNTSGGCNIFIGVGADSYYNHISQGISIGSVSTLTSTYGISIGQNIANQREYNVLVGFGIQSDANNSVLLGKDISIQSIVYFKNPISYAIRDPVAVDAKNKFGIIDINYGTLLSSPDSVYANTGITTSNIVNSTTNTPNNRVSPSSFDLRNVVNPYPYANFQGKVILLRSNVNLQATTSVSRSDIDTSLSFHLPEVVIKNKDTIYSHGCNVEITYNRSDVVTNIRSFDTSKAVIPVYSVKRVESPSLPFSSCNITIEKSVLAYQQNPLIVPFSLKSVWDGQGITGSNLGNVYYVVSEPPKKGILNKSIFTSNDTILYKPNYECAFDGGDSFKIQPVLQIVDGSNFMFGRPSPTTMTTNLFFANTSNFSLARRKILNANDFFLTTADLQRIPYYNDADVVQFIDIASNATVKVGNTIYTSNDVALMLSESVLDYPNSIYDYLVNSSFSNIVFAISCNESYVKNNVIQPNVTILADFALSYSNILDNPYAQFGLSNIASVSCNLVNYNIKQIPSMYSSLNNQVYNWITTYDPTYSRTESIDLLQNSANIGQGFNQYPWVNIQTSLEELYSKKTTNLQSALSHTSNILSKPYPSSPDATLYIQGFSNEVALLYRKYFQIPRLFLSYSNLRTPGYVKLTCQGTVTNAFTIKASSDTCVIDTEYGVLDKWDTIPFSNLTSKILASSKFGAQNVAYPNKVLQYDSIVLSYIPEHGKVSLGQLSNLSDVSYKSFNPFASSDVARFVISKNGRSEEIEWNIGYSNQSLIIDQSLYGLDYMYGRESEVTTSQFLYSNETVVKPIYNTLIVNETNFVPGQPRTSFNIQSNIVFPYVPSQGYFVETSNILSCNTYYIEDTDPWNGSNIIREETHIVSSNTLLNGSLTINTQDIDKILYSYPNFTSYNSNTIYLKHIDIDQRWYTASNEIYSTIDTDHITKSYFAAHDPSYYLYTSNLPFTKRRQSEVVSSYDIEETTGSNAYIYKNYYYIQSNISFFEPLLLLNRNLLHASNASFLSYTCNVFITSNQGFVTSFTQDEVNNNKVAISLSTSPSFVNIKPSNVPYSVPVQITKFDSSKISQPSHSELFGTLDVVGGEPYASLTNLLHPSLNGVSTVFIPSHINIVKVQKGSIIDENDFISSRIAIADLPQTKYMCTSNYESDEISFFYSYDKFATTPITLYLDLYKEPYYDTQYFNIGLSKYPNTLSPYAFNWHKTSQIEVTSTDPHIQVRPSIFKPGDEVRIKFTNDIPGSFQYNARSTDGGSVVAPARAFNLIPYKFSSFIQPKDTADFVIQQLGTAPHVSNIIKGSSFNQIDGLLEQGVPIIRSNVDIYVAQRSNIGFFWNENAPHEVASRFKLSDVDSNHIHFIPYDSSNLGNTPITVQLLYNSNMSPIYPCTLRNYVSRFPNIAISPTVRAQHTWSTSNIPKSQGLVADGMYWSPSLISIPYEDKYTASNIYALSLNTHYTDHFKVNYYATSHPIGWNSSNPIVSLEVDQADSVSLSPLLEQVRNPEPGKVQCIWFYVSSNASHGYIQNVESKEAIIRFSDTDLMNNSIVYQHIGNESSNDVLKIAISTTPYDLEMQDATISISIRPLPKITKNKVCHIYYETKTDALTGKDVLSSNLSIEGSGYVHLVDKSGIHVKDRGTNVVVDTFSLTKLASNQVYFQISSEEALSQPPYPVFSLTLATNNHSQPHTNPLAQIHSIYQDVFLYPYEVYLNKFISSNVAPNDLPTEHKITYTFDADEIGYSNITDRVISYLIQVKPSQNLLPDGFQQPAGVLDTAFLRTFDYTISMKDAQEQKLAEMLFQEDKISLTTPQSNIELQFPSALTYSFGKWNNFLFVNQDPDNDLNASLYLQYDSTKTKQANTANNILRDVVIPAVNLNTIKTIDITTVPNSSKNFLESYHTTKQILSTPESLYATFQITNYSTMIGFKNQELSATTYRVNEQQETVVNTIPVHNVVMGKNIEVRGKNNLCLGNNFNTTGENSIILGNDIGTGSVDGVLNDVYESIIIGSKSYQNSVVRDIISIGNNNLNALNQISPVKVNAFLAQKPLVIGNDISEKSIDFNINIADTFLKTKVGYDQIYLGQSGEPVCVGYTSNMQFNNDHSVYVNGGISSEYITTDVHLMHFQSAVNLVKGTLVSCVDGGGNVEATMTPMDQRIVGVVYDCIVVSPDIYRVRVQYMGRVSLQAVGNIEAGSLLTSSSISGVCTVQTDNIRYSYTIAKALTSANISPSAPQFIPCLLLT
jgi:hypothetical protein